MLALSLLGLIAGGLVWLFLPDDTPQPATEDEFAVKSVPRPTAASLGYVGWQACLECHQQRVADFRETRHFHACEIATQAPLVAGFQPGQGTFQVPGTDVRFEMSVRDGTPLLTTVAQKTQVTSPVAYVYGSGAGTDEAYFAWRDESIYELPLAWLHPQGQWGVSQFDPDAPGDFSRSLTPQCLECHTLWIDYHAGSHYQYTRPEPFQLGVTCERCHGPARDHVDYHQAHPRAESGHAIVQPAKLTRERLMDLCAQCHGNAVRHRQAPFSYRPGEVLADSFRVLHPKFPEDNRVANQDQYLRESRCYQQSDSMTCITCHDPHHRREADAANAGSRSCVGCHQPDKCHAQPQLPAGIRNNCVGCHMPLRNKVQVNFEQADGEIVFPAPRYEHKIGIYPEATNLVLHDWYAKQRDPDSEARRDQLAAELAQWWTEHGTSVRKEGRFLIALDAFRTALKFHDTPQLREQVLESQRTYKQTNADWYQGQRLKRERQLPAAIALYERLLNIAPQMTKVHFELGSMYAATNDGQRALEHLQAAIRDDPEDPSANAMLGWLYFLKGRYSESLGHYQAAVELEPWSDRISFMIAQCQGQLNRMSETLAALEKTLTINPHHREALAISRKLLREGMTAVDAQPAAQRIVQLTNAEEPEPLLTLAEILHDQQQHAAASRALAVALKLAEKQRPDLVPSLRQLEGEWNSPKKR